MSPLALVLVLGAALAHAGWNVLAHGTSRLGIPFLWCGAVASALIWAVAVPLTGGIGAADLAGFTLGVAVSAVVHVAYMLVLQRGYAVGNLSTVYATARGTGPLLAVAASVALLGERPSLLALTGVAAIIAGVVAVGLVDRPRAAPGLGAGGRGRGRRGIPRLAASVSRPLPARGRARPLRRMAREHRRIQGRGRRGRGVIAGSPRAHRSRRDPRLAASCGLPAAPHRPDTSPRTPAPHPSPDTPEPRSGVSTPPREQDPETDHVPLRLRRAPRPRIPCLLRPQDRAGQTPQPGPHRPRPQALMSCSPCSGRRHL